MPKETFFQIFLVEIIIDPHHRGDPNLKLSDQDPHNSNHHHNNNNLDHSMYIRTVRSQNSQQKSVPDLYVVTVAFLALKKPVLFTFSDPPPPQKKISIFFYEIIM